MLTLWLTQSDPRSNRRRRAYFRLVGKADDGPRKGGRGYGRREAGGRRLLAGLLRREWIKAYDAPVDTLARQEGADRRPNPAALQPCRARPQHPGHAARGDRRAFEGETDPRKKRVKGAMLAGALFNRAIEVFTKAVEMSALGIEIRPNDALMRQCGEHLKEALALGQLVLHRSGEEGMDELWGEPFKAFAFPMEFLPQPLHQDRGQAMRPIERIGNALAACSRGSHVRRHRGAGSRRSSAPPKSSARPSKPIPRSSTSGPRSCPPASGSAPSSRRCSRQRHSLDDRLRAAQGVQLIAAGKELISQQNQQRALRGAKAVVERMALERAGAGRRWSFSPSDANVDQTSQISGMVWRVSHFAAPRTSDGELQTPANVGPPRTSAPACRRGARSGAWWPLRIPCRGCVRSPQSGRRTL